MLCFYLYISIEVFCLIPLSVSSCTLIIYNSKNWASQKKTIEMNITQNALVILFQTINILLN